MRIFFVLLTIVVIANGCGSVEQTVVNRQAENPPVEDAYTLGRKIYNEGILPSGEPVQAFVQQDIPIDGRMVTCESCHLRSGLGSKESYIVVPPTNGRLLYRSRKYWDYWGRHDSLQTDDPKARQVPSFLMAEDFRPAYTDETLAVAMRSGVDPTGYVMDYAMPRYTLSDRDMNLLINYLKSLSGEFSPGVTDDTIHFATIVTDGVSKEDKQAMLAVLQDIIDNKNVQTRNQKGRSKRGTFFNWEKDTAYRLLHLSVWELTGERETWQQQLEAYYEAEPVFAVLGGIASGDWAPIHEFSEQHNLPCLFPITDLPVISDNDWNTLYLSKGIYQEGEAVAKYLRRDERLKQVERIVQVFRDASLGAVVARGFQETWGKFGRVAVENRPLGSTEQMSDHFWKKLAEEKQTSIVLFWLDKKDMDSLETLQQIPHRPIMVFLSSSLLEQDFSTVPDATRDFVYITYPYSLPQEKEKEMAILKTWLKVRDIPVTNLRIQSSMFFIGKQLTGALMHMKSEFYRDYFLEAFDMLVDQTVGIAVYPWLSFGPGQRYASKGCYVVQLTKGPDPIFLGKSGWVIP